MDKVKKYIENLSGRSISNKEFQNKHSKIRISPKKHMALKKIADAVTMTQSTPSTERSKLKNSPLIADISLPSLESRVKDSVRENEREINRLNNLESEVLKKVQKLREEESIPRHKKAKKMVNCLTSRENSKNNECEQKALKKYLFKDDGNLNMRKNSDSSLMNEIINSAYNEINLLLEQNRFLSSQLVELWLFSIIAKQV